MSETKAPDDGFDGMTPEERLDWLRQRGVEIETAEERNLTPENAADPNDGEWEHVTCVSIPQDPSRPMKEYAFKQSKSGGTIQKDGWPDTLKCFFSGNGEVDLTLMKDRSNVQFGTSNGPAVVSEAAMEKVAARGNTETFCLVKPVSSNKFTGVNIYLDEAGMLKRLPLNSRAVKMAGRAGFNPPPNIYGDVFIGRVTTKPFLRNVDMKIGVDTSPTAPWLVNAMMENLEHQTAMNAISGRNDLQPTPDGEDGVQKQELGYSWTQNDEEIEIKVPIPKEASVKTIKVKFLPRCLKINLQGKEILNVALFDRIDTEGCTWTLDTEQSGKVLLVTCEKAEPLSWPRCTK